MPTRLVFVALALALACAPAAAQSLQRQVKLHSPLRGAPPINGNPAYPAAQGFGGSLSVSGATAAISERMPFGGQRIRLYERDATGHWSAQHVLLPPDDLSASEEASFGGRYVLDGDRLAVWLQGHQSDPRVIIYEKTAGAWAESARIEAQPYLALNGSFGQGGLGLSGDTLAIGSPGAVVDALGAVHVFVHDGSGWMLQQVVTETDPYPAASFGSSLALQGDRLVVNRPGRYPDMATSYGVYVFERSGSGWSQQARIVKPHGGFVGYGYFGQAMALDGERLAIPDMELRDVGGSGDAFDVVRIYARDGSGNWPLVDSLDTGARHGGNPAPLLSVALRGDRVLVGEVYSNTDLYEGRRPNVHLFEHSGGAWSAPRTFSPFDWAHGWDEGLQYGAGFGEPGEIGTLAFDDAGAALVGARLDAIQVPLVMNSPAPGAVYVLTDSDDLFCDGFEDDDPERCQSMRPR